MLAPLPLHVNPGFQAWTSSNPATPVVFAMRCNPQHGALAHEMGHRLGMAHASVYRPDDGRVPVDPLGPGVMDDSGADPMDVMSSARGQYGLQSR